MITALFVEKNGCYYNLRDIDPWDKERDARTYIGFNPVIAHPPCQRWGKMARVNFSRWGGKHNKPTLSKKEANSTPLRFRNELIKLVKVITI